MKKILVMASVIATLCSCKTTEAEKFADNLIKQMTLREKIGQMSQFAPGTGIITGPQGEKRNIKSLIKAGEVGSILGASTPEQIEELQRLAVDSSRLRIPILFGHDIIHGCKVIFPINLACACSWDIDAIRESARIAAFEASAMGLAWTFSPMCDISADPRWGRVSEGAGEDPYLGSKISAAMVEGYQGHDLADSSTILACVKHFAAYGAPEAGRDYNTVDMSERMFRDRYLPPYRSAIEAGAGSVMSSFNDFEAIPVSGNRKMLKDLLRDELGFKGFVVSDYNSVIEMIAHGVAKDEKEAAYKALRASLDMEMVSGSYLNHAEELIKEGLISERVIDQMCRNILITKYNLGLFEDPFRYGGAERFANAIHKPENLEFARKVARESMVLLKNTDKILPLKEGQKIALIGPFIKDQKSMMGSWCGHGESKRVVTIEQGLKKRFPGQITAVEGCEPFRHINGGIEEAVNAAKKADIVLITLGLPGSLSGEGGSLVSVEIPESQKDLLAAVKSTGKPVAVLLVTGRPMALESTDSMMDALLTVWLPGTMCGTAVADLVSGDYSPSGHLAMSFPRCDGQIPIRYNHKNTGRPYMGDRLATPDNIYKSYTSSYVFTPTTPLYPFGYGLSYTEFAFDDLEIMTPEVALGEKAKIRASVSNIGETDGAVVAQLYIRDLVASTTRPVKELKGFKKIHLKAGESSTVEFTLTPEDMSFCREDMKFGQEPGEFAVWVGNNSNASLEGRFIVK